MSHIQIYPKPQYAEESDGFHSKSSRMKSVTDLQSSDAMSRECS